MRRAGDSNHAVRLGRDTFRVGKVTTRDAAAAEIGRLINHILALAPDAGLYVSIKVEPAKSLPHPPHASHLSDSDRAQEAGAFPLGVSFIDHFEGVTSSQEAQDHV